MAEYIEREALKRAIRKAFHDIGMRIDINSVINIQPTADVVEVVRCKDCKHAEIQDYAPPSCRYCCKYSALYHAKNFYCSMGERREDAEAVNTKN